MPEIIDKDDVPARLNTLDWNTISDDLNQHGFAVIKGLLNPQQCLGLRARYDQPEQFRSRVVMERYNFGRGEYQYFNYPLPEIVQTLRTLIYPKLAVICNRWNTLLKREERFPETHQQYLDICHNAGQTRPTPLMLRYQKNDFNCLHQDLYGEHYFPLQLAILLSKKEAEFKGGEFALTEQRPRCQSRVHVVDIDQGDAVVFAVDYRPVNGSKSIYRTRLRHGVSKVHQGERYTLGVIFHDAS